MTVKECYEAMAGSYEEALGRLMDDARIKKFLTKFLQDVSYDALCEAMENKDAEAAFKAVHNLKGVSSNLSLTALQKAGEKLTEALRGKDYSQEAEDIFEEVRSSYKITRAAIEELAAEE